MVVITGNESADKPILEAVHSQYLPDKIVLVKNEGSNKAADGRLTMFSNKGLIDGQPTVYICNDYGCQPPVSDVDSFNLAMTRLLKDRKKGDWQINIPSYSS